MITINCNLDTQLEFGRRPLPAFRSLAQIHVDAVEQVVSQAKAKWSVQLHHDYDGYLSLIVEPINHDSPTLLVSGTTNRIEVSKLDHEDRMVSCGNFSDTQAMTTKLADLLAD